MSESERQLRDQFEMLAVQKGLCITRFCAVYMERSTEEAWRKFKASPLAARQSTTKS